MGNCPCFNQPGVCPRELIISRDHTKPHLRMLLRTYQDKIIPEIKDLYIRVLCADPDSLSTLDFKNVELNEFSCNLLSSLFIHLHSLAVVNLKNNNLGENELSILCSGLMLVPTLSVLKITHNKVNDSGLSHIQQLLKKLYLLEELDLSYNEIGNGLISLLPVFKCLNSIRILSVQGNSLDLSSLIVFSSQLKCIDSLTNINLDDKLSKSQKESLKDILSDNQNVFYF